MSYQVPEPLDVEERPSAKVRDTQDNVRRKMTPEERTASRISFGKRFEWALQDMHENYGLRGKLLDYTAEIGMLRMKLDATREENEAAEKSQTAREQRQHREKMETLDKEYAQTLHEIDANNAHDLTRFIQELEMKQRETPEERFVRAISAYQRARTMMDWINEEPDPNERRRIRQEIKDLMSKAWK